jgi:nitroreductase
MTHSSPLLDALLARRSASAKHLIAPGPTAAALDRILLAGSRAPDHGRLVPFRFFTIADEGREAFGAVLAAASLEERPDLAAAEIDRAREKAHQGPCLIALIARIDPEHPKIPASDQWLSAGCALENMVLAAQAEGLGVAIRSGKYLESAAVRRAFGLTAIEHFCCFLAIGSVSEWPPAKPKPALESIVSRWTGSTVGP